MAGAFRPQAWHVEVRGVSEPIVVAAFATRLGAEEFREEYNALVEFDEQAYICLCDCPERECLHLIAVPGC
jgi:hypothetical protein